MAHLQKLKAATLPGLLHHNRRDNRSTLDRDNIDAERSRDNYDLVPDTVEERIREVRESHEEVTGRAVRKDAVVAASWIVTLPEDVEPEREREFFQVTARFLRERYGRDNLVQATVHVDEPGRDHMHALVVPEREGKLQASKVMNRRDLQTFHQDLSRTIEREMGCAYSVQVERGDAAEKRMNRLDQPEWQACQDAIRDAREREEQARQAMERMERQREQMQREMIIERERLEEVRQAREGAEGRVRQLQQLLRGLVERARAAVERAREQVRERGRELGRAAADIRYVLERPGEMGRARWEACAERAWGRMGYTYKNMWLAEHEYEQRERTPKMQLERAYEKSRDYNARRHERDDREQGRDTVSRDGLHGIDCVFDAAEAQRQAMSEAMRNAEREHQQRPGFER